MTTVNLFTTAALTSASALECQEKKKTKKQNCHRSLLLFRSQHHPITRTNGGRTSGNTAGAFCEAQLWKNKKSRRFLSTGLGTLQLSINVLLWLNAGKETNKTRVFLLHPRSKCELHLVLCGTWWGSIGVEDGQVRSGNICGSGRCCRESCSWKWWKRLADLRIKMQKTQEGRDIIALRCNDILRYILLRWRTSIPLVDLGFASLLLFPLASEFVTLYVTLQSPFDYL